MTRWETFEKLPRPLKRYVALFGSAWAMGLCDIAGASLDPATRGVIFTFALGVYGVRGWENMKGKTNAE